MTLAKVSQHPGWNKVAGAGGLDGWPHGEGQVLRFKLPQAVTREPQTGPKIKFTKEEQKVEMDLLIKPQSQGARREWFRADRIKPALY